MTAIPTTKGERQLLAALKKIASRGCNVSGCYAGQPHASGCTRGIALEAISRFEKTQRQRGIVDQMGELAYSAGAALAREARRRKARQ